MSEESLQAKPLRSSGVLIGLVAGIATGVFLGQLCEPLGVVADGFVALLQMTVLPYIVVSLIGSLGRLTLRQSRKLAAVGGAVLLVLWTIALLTVVVVSLVFFSSRQSAAFFSTATFDPPKQINLVEMFVPGTFVLPRAMSNAALPWPAFSFFDAASFENELKPAAMALLLRGSTFTLYGGSVFTK